MQGELKLTVLISWESGHSVIQSHVAALPDRPQPPVKVQVKSYSFMLVQKTKTKTSVLSDS